MIGLSKYYPLEAENRRLV